MALSDHAKRRIASEVNKRTAFQLKKRYNDAMATEPFEPWMKSYAQWLAERPDAPAMDRRRAAAAQRAKVKLTAKAVRALEARDDFQTYYREVREGGIRAARHKFTTTLPEAVDTLEWALAEAKKIGDYKSVLNHSAQIYDRIFPKKQEQEHAAVAVQIVVQAKQAAALEQEYPEVSVEEVIIEDAD